MHGNKQTQSSCLQFLIEGCWLRYEVNLNVAFVGAIASYSACLCSLSQGSLLLLSSVCRRYMLALLAWALLHCIIDWSVSLSTSQSQCIQSVYGLPSCPVYGWTQAFSWCCYLQGIDPLLRVGFQEFGSCRVAVHSRQVVCRFCRAVLCAQCPLPQAGLFFLK